jgi:hypothetical protein
MLRRHLTLAALLTFALPAMTFAAAPQWSGQVVVQWGAQDGLQRAYREGYDRGVRAGQLDGRRSGGFRFQDESDYRRGDFGYRREYGNVDRYRAEFRRGFELGYREGFARFDRGSNGRYGSGPWSGGPAYGRTDLASSNGYTDGYNEGLHDGRDRNRFNPLGERRYRSGDHGYDRSYGSKDRYKVVYRDAFREGYEAGFRDGTRYVR